MIEMPLTAAKDFASLPSIFSTVVKLTINRLCLTSPRLFPPTFVGSIFSCSSFEWQNGRDFGLVDFAGVFPVILEIEAIV
jgi:hypothetical protein